ncbi:MAG: amidohydrolase [Acidimicrobiia bacterium]
MSSPSRPPIVVFPAKRVRTMDRSRPEAEAIAIRGDRIRAVGTVEELMSYPGAVLDERFADSVIVPGFVEAHAHSFGAALWAHPYVGYFDRRDPNGTLWRGCDSIDAAVDRLIEVDAAMPGSDTVLMAWGFDAIYFGGERLVAKHLDRVSTTRPIYVLHASGHVATVNTALIRLRKIDESTAVVGVVTDENGYPNGELQEPAAMSLAGVFEKFMASTDDRATLRAFAAEAANAGCTTVVDLLQRKLLNPGWPESVSGIVEAADFPVRYVPFSPAGASPSSIERTITALEAAKEFQTDKLRIGTGVKIILDGSIQQFTARLQEPGYFDNDSKGIWVTAPDQYREMFAALHAAGCLIHVHCNGDEASEVFLDALELALERHPRWDHRHTMTHSQLTTPAQYRRLAALAGCANIFANHIWYWGDQHRDRILGPDRAARMDACATALASGVPISIHCDTPVTPIDPLATMHHAVNRITPSGRVLGPDERITAEEGLHAITLGAAFTLKMDHLVGSLTAGKLADMAVLDADPIEVAPTEIAAITVRATVLGGVVRPSQASER